MNGSTLCGNGTSLLLRHSWTETLSLFAPTALLVDRTLSPVWYVIGILGNPLSARIWYCKRLRKNNSSAAYLIGLSVSDLIFLVLHFVMELNNAWDIHFQHLTGFCETFNFLYLIPQYTSPMLVLAFTVERYMAVCHPFTKEKICMMSRAIKVVVVIVAVATVLCFPQIYLWTFDEQFRRCHHRVTAMSGGNLSFSNIWTWFTEMLIFGVVPVAVFVLNLFVIREVKKVSLGHMESRRGMYRSTNTNNSTSTITLLWVSFYLIVTTLPTTIVYCIQGFIHMGNSCLSDSAILLDPSWQGYFNFVTARKCIEEACLSHHACNFLIYSATGKRFYREVKRNIACSNKSKRDKRLHNYLVTDSKKPFVNRNCMMSNNTNNGILSTPNNTTPHMTTTVL